VLDLFEKMSYPPEKTLFILNRVEDERNRQRVTIPSETIEKHLKRKIEARIPDNEPVILNAINKGVPVVALQRDRKTSPVKELMDFSDHVFTLLMGDQEPASQPKAETGEKKRSGLNLRLGL
jgi:septum formation inhibitor-activating ATPase MinD